ncbi:MAG: hypothetical protein JJE17_00480 [Peptostreptococcaceae bacterium]|nr:hypothetical protein [Peptostreptococcaceae bacterium]
MKRPIILDYAIERTGNNKKDFHYEYTRDINVTNINGINMPFIELTEYSKELETKTRVERESDDEGYNLLELTTKTAVQREQDDEEYCLSELLTKTEVEREQDDESYNTLELYSKTYVERERDDEDNINFN